MQRQLHPTCVKGGPQCPQHHNHSHASFATSEEYQVTIEQSDHTVAVMKNEVYLPQSEVIENDSGDAYSSDGYSSDEQ